MAGDFWGITAVFVPAGAPHVLANLQAFSTALHRQGLPLLVVELALDDAPFAVPDSVANRILRLRTSTVLWHKERLLNLGVASLPGDCRYVAWLDADVLFERDEWVADTRQRLDDHVVVQPFETACWLTAGQTVASPDMPVGIGDGHQLSGFAAALHHAPERRWALAAFERSGHTGFAWAARRELLDRHGLYDRAILGGGDVLNAHAFAADGDFLRGRNFYMRGLTRAERAAYAEWGEGVAADTGGRIGFTPGRVLHLFHGPLAARHYLERLEILKDAAFDPLQDIGADTNGCWRWNSDKPELHQRTRDYFAARAKAASEPAATA
jgi:hypothetical protein